MNRFVIRSIWLAVLLGAVVAHAQQIPFLERKITIRISNESGDQALKRISQQGGFTFSYNSSLIKSDKLVSGNFVNQPVREVLDQLFLGTLQYKERGKYIILARAATSAKEKEKVITGYVVDEATGERLKDVAIYDPVSLSSTLSDDFGYFELKLDKRPTDLKLVINKPNYSDTLIAAPSGDGRLFNVKMKRTASKISTLADTVGVRLMRFWKTKFFKKPIKTMIAVTDTFHRKTQISFLPFIGTNHTLSGNVVNDFSFNVLGGYSLGVGKMEIGGLFNTVRSDVKGFQLAGIFNAVAGETEGVQVAGIFNANHGAVKGGQLAGIFNFHWNEVSYFAGAGILNFNRKGSDAVQLAGITNFTLGEQTMPHFAGIVNFTTGDAKSQVAGIVNFSKRMTGLQVAGIANAAYGDVIGGQLSGIANVSTKSVTGSQVAGILNLSLGTVKGSQVGSILNVARKVKGVQLGLFNVSDSVGGVPIGLLSFVNQGYHKFELSADEVFFANASLRSGVRQFYNIFTAGIKTSTLKDTATHWTFGYGIGTAPRLSRTLALNIDVTSNQIVQGSDLVDVNLLNKFNLGLDLQIAPKFSLAVAATLNAHVTRISEEPSYWELFDQFKPDILSDQNVGDDFRLRMWIGGKVALRFF